MSRGKWQFWIDRGGTFTDLVALSPQGEIITHKLLSENPQKYQDAPVQGIKNILKLEPQEPIPTSEIAAIKMGTTVATNALLERKGEKVVLVTTKGFKDALRIGYQNRPDIFALKIDLPEMLYVEAIEVDERYTSTGEELQAIDPQKVTADLQDIFARGIRSCAVVFMHAYAYPQHELAVGEIARQIGFTQVSLSHQISPLIKFVSRGDTTVVDAYLSPILHRYIAGFRTNLFANSEQEQQTQLMFMQSNGGLVAADSFQGKDSILSGPAGGIVGAVKTCAQAGFSKIIGFDMGGTSTDVSHYRGEYERSWETEVAGVRLRSPMLAIHTVAAGGSSLLHFENGRYCVGPDSAGSNPGAACYGRGGELTITDCNVMLGKLQPQFFPNIFGKQGNQKLDQELVKTKFQALAEQIQDGRSPVEIAHSFIAIAILNMANAIKKISLQRGYDVREYVLCCFGGAGGQHACLLADALGMEQIFIHPYAGVLSAYGIGLADLIITKEKTLEIPLVANSIRKIEEAFTNLEQLARSELAQQKIGQKENITIKTRLNLKYQGSDTSLVVVFGSLKSMEQAFIELHQQRYGFSHQNKGITVEMITLELVCPTYQPTNMAAETDLNQKNTAKKPIPQAIISMHVSGTWQDTPVYERAQLLPGMKIEAPAIVTEATGTNIIEKGWQGYISDRQDLILTKIKSDLA